MIYPTRLAVLLVAAGAPVALLLALLAPGFWIAGPVWVAALCGLIGFDGLLAPRRGAAQFAIEAPDELAMPSGRAEAELLVDFPGRAPRKIETTLETNAKLTSTPARFIAATSAGEATRANFQLAPVRRGEGVLLRGWARWSGPLGLIWVQASAALDHRIAITPDLKSVREEATRLFARNAFLGQKSRPETGDGFEFHALREFQPGMDLRAVDWKQSARHGQLLSKEFRTERNHPIMLALDSGRLMGEPVDGAPKLDRAINAALLIAYIALALGDRVGLCAFDARPRLLGKPIAGRAAFTALRRQAAAIDYASEETNFTLGLSAVGAELDRRALLVVFTDFADPTSAQLMLESANRLSQRHLLLFVLFEDAELEAVRSTVPESPHEVSRAVTADALLRQRELVVAGLRRLGAEVIEAPAAAIGTALIDRYLALKRLDRL